MFNYSSEYRSNVSTIDYDKFTDVRKPVFYDLPFTIGMAFVAVVTSLLTISGNLIVLLSFFLEKSIRQPSNYFIASLAVSDLLIGAISIPFYAAYLLSGHYWLLGEILCDVWLSIDYSACLCSIYTVFCITIDRYCSVRIPAKYRAWRSKRKILFIIAIIWTIPVLVFFTSIFGWQYFTGKRDLEVGECDVQYMKNAVFNSVLQIGYFWVTLFFMVALYVGIYRVVLRLQKKSEEKREKIARLVASASSAKVVKPQSTVIPQTVDNEVDHLEQKVIECSVEQKHNKIEKESSEFNANSTKCFLDESTSISFIQANNKVDEKELIDTNSKAQTSDLFNKNIRDENQIKNNDNKRQDIIIKIDSCIEKVENSENKKLELYLQHKPETILKNETRKIIDSSLKKYNKEKYDKIKENFSEDLQNNVEDTHDEQYKDVVSDALLHASSTSLCCDSNQWHRKNSLGMCNSNNFLNNETNKLNEKYQNTKMKKIYKNEKQCRSSNFEIKTYFSDEKDLSVIQNDFDSKKCYTIETSALNPDEQDSGHRDIKKQKKLNKKIILKSTKTRCSKTCLKNNEEENNNNNENAVTASSSSDKEHQNTKNNHFKKQPSRREDRAFKALRTITLILGAFVLCWTPWHLLSFIMGFCPSCVNSVLYDISYWLCYTNSPINPFCYAFANYQFKKTFIRIVKLDWQKN